MSDRSTSAHDEIVELLPDYAVGGLDEETLRRVDEHLAGCEACRQELDNLLEALGLLTVAPPPRPEIRDEILSRVAVLAAAPRDADRLDAPRAEPPTPFAFPPSLVPIPTDRPPASALPPRPTVARPWWASPPSLAVAAGLLVALLGLAAWNLLLLRERLDEPEAVVSFIGGADAAHALADSQFPSSATGVIYSGPNRRDALLVVHGLPSIPDDERYQVWLFTAAGERVSGGLFPVADDGQAMAFVRAPAPFKEYVALGVSNEPRDGSPAPTSPLALGGWLEPNPATPPAP